MAYISWSDYTAGGGTVTVEATFNALEYAARAYLDKVTHRRISYMSAVPEAVEMLMIELVNMESARRALIDAPALSSASNDGVSESYAEPMTTARLDERRDQLVNEYLNGIEDDNGVLLLFAGVSYYDIVSQMVE